MPDGMARVDCHLLSGSWHEVWKLRGFSGSGMGQQCLGTGNIVQPSGSVSGQ